MQRSIVEFASFRADKIDLHNEEITKKNEELNKPSREQISKMTNKILKKYMCKYGMLTCIGVLLTLAGGFGELATPWFIGEIIAGMSNNDQEAVIDYIKLWLIVQSITSVFNGL